MTGAVDIRESQAKTILRKHKRIDSWFVARYGMNLYRGCIHNCVYCDGRDERYQVAGEFGKEVEVKVNAIEILSRELDPSRKRKPMRTGYVMLGGGVGDSYQPAEERCRLTRKALELMIAYKHPVHILTKSTLVERDLDLLMHINQIAGAIVSFSFSSVDEEISARFEPGVPSPAERMAVIRRLKRAGLNCGAFLMPVIPFITDTPDQMAASVRSLKDAGVDFIIFSGMTLKEGRQKEYFLNILKRFYPDLAAEYETIYRGSPWGGATRVYHEKIHQGFRSVISRCRISVRIPRYLFQDILDENDYVTVILDHLDYLLMLRGRTSPFGYAAYQISQLKEPLSFLRESLCEIKGVGRVTERIIKEILETGTCRQYEELMDF